VEVPVCFRGTAGGSASWGCACRPPLLIQYPQTHVNTSKMTGRLSQRFDRMLTTRWNYWLGMVCDQLVAAFFVAAFVWAHGWRTETLGSGIALAALGLLAGSLTEYASHRWCFHNPRFPCYRAHMQHHQDPERLISLPFFSSALVALPLWILLRLFASAPSAAVFLGVFTLNYGLYGVWHHVSHHSRMGSSSLRFAQRLRAHHRIHHHMPGTNYGVTTSLWDHLFRTHYKAKRQVDPQRVA
jgi:sterol desaturase/sphingolipid hydroxylase (fatty acid hydroxylase superfamily)